MIKRDCLVWLGLRLLGSEICNFSPIHFNSRIDIRNYVFHRSPGISDNFMFGYSPPDGVRDAFQISSTSPCCRQFTSLSIFSPFLADMLPFPKLQADCLTCPWHLATYHWPRHTSPQLVLGLPLHCIVMAQL